MIRIDKVVKEFRAASLPLMKKAPGLRALDGVSFTVEKGEATALAGRNGAGKTTLLKVLCTLVIPDSGTVEIAEADAIRHPGAVRSRIGFAGGDERSFYWRLTGRQNLHLFGALQNVPRLALPETVSEALSLVGLGAKADVPFRNYSSGMRQRLAIARCLLHDPAVILLDEPTKGLDPLLQQELVTFIRRELVEKREKTVLLATHNLAEAVSVADTTILLEKGKILFKGKPENEDELHEIMQAAALSAGGPAGEL